MVKLVRNRAKLLACGGRDYGDKEHVFESLDAVVAKLRERGFDGFSLAHGGASGADVLAESWAEERGLEVKWYPADWSRGPRAGPERNQRMLEEYGPTHVVAFPGGRGTVDMVRRAEGAGVPVWRVPPRGAPLEGP